MKRAAICLAVSATIYVVGSPVTIDAARAADTARAADAAGPTTQRASAIEAAYADLGSPQPAKRNAARAELLGLTRDELPALRDVVRSDRPTSPEQAVQLRDIVRHVFLAGETYERSEYGFLGLKPMNALSLGVDMPDGSVIAGVSFSQRNVGFCAYRWLQDGDVILSIAARGTVTQTDSFQVMSGVIRGLAPATPIEMRVFRNGAILPLRFAIDARPKAFDIGADIATFVSERLSRAEAYWKSDFAPLVDPDLT